MLNDLYFKTTCNIRPYFLGPIGGLKIEGPLYFLGPIGGLKIEGPLYYVTVVPLYCGGRFCQVTL